MGNKLDLIDGNPNRREVTKEEGKKFAKQNKTLFFETSAKKNNNVVESDKSPNMHYDLLYKSKINIQNLSTYYYSNTCG